MPELRYRNRGRRRVAVPDIDPETPGRQIAREAHRNRLHQHGLVGGRATLGKGAISTLPSSWRIKTNGRTRLGGAGSLVASGVCKKTRTRDDSTI